MKCAYQSFASPFVLVERSSRTTPAASPVRFSAASPAAQSRRVNTRFPTDIHATFKDSEICSTCILATCRSEEHTSELQSLMRISSAVFCLKKKKKNTQQ